MVPRVAKAVVAADEARTPAKLGVAIGSMPSNVQSCWSSYPFIDDQKMPVLQATTKNGQVLFTLVDVSTHNETLSFSGVPSYTHELSADWAGRMRQALEARWPGSIGIEVAGLVGSVETPTVYEPESTQVLRIPGALHNVPGNPNGCSSVYPQPSSGKPVEDAEQFLTAYGDSIANTAAATLQHADNVVPETVKVQQVRCASNSKTTSSRQPSRSVSSPIVRHTRTRSAASKAAANRKSRPTSKPAWACSRSAPSSSRTRLAKCSRSPRLAGRSTRNRCRSQPTATNRPRKTSSAARRCR
jgi:hypothetical protein